MVMGLISFLVFSFSFFTTTFAANEFATSYDTNYDFKENGVAKITQNITLTNLTTDYRATSYTLTIPSPHVQNVFGSDRLGSLKITTNQDNEKTEIEAVFNDVVAGKGKVLNWTLSYESSEYARKNGQVWEISIPGIPEEENLNEYTVSLKIPEVFGPLLYFSPTPKTDFTWTKDEIGKGGINAAFGETQSFDFSLKYHLTNPKPYPVWSEIALPSDTPYQKVFIKSLLPHPKDVVIDKDGNWLAQYDLEASETIEIKAIGQALLYFTPQEKETLTKEMKTQYLLPQKYWEVGDLKIKEVAKSLKTPKDVYDYVVNTLDYDYQKVAGPVKRLGAKEALKNKSNAICMEFTDLFIALARSIGIPARELDGFAHTTNTKLRPLSLEKDILHAWPEYYDENKQMWIAVDPTWGNTTKGIDYFTKLDLNHFVFTTKGISSEYPLPAGSYKDKEEKDVDVTLSLKKADFPKNPQPELKIILPQKIIAGLPFLAKIEVKNESGVLISADNLIISSENMSFENETQKLGLLPPFSQRSLTLKIKALPFWTSTQGKLKINNGLETKEATVLIQPIIFDRISQIVIGGIFAIAALLTIAKVTRRIYHERQKESDSLRGQSDKPQGESQIVPPK